MLVEAASSAAEAPGPRRGFYERVRARRGIQVAIVATARKLTVLCWHLSIKGEDYAFAMPSLVAHKQRMLELRAGLPPARGRKGASAPYSLKQARAAEPDLATQSELAYRTMVASWRPNPPANKTPTRQTTSHAPSGRGRQHRDTTLTPSG